MKQIIFLLLSTICWANCQTTSKDTKHIFYLHGRIIELQGVNAVSEKFGKYEYNAIIDTLKATGATIHNTVRTEETDFQEFCELTSNEINQLVESGVNPNQITVIGASKGAVMAMNIAQLNSYPINYILLAANNSQIEEQNNWNLHGRILGIYEKSDALAGKNYQYWIEKSTNATAFEQLEINTGLGHGFLYRPLKAWMEPARKWIKNESSRKKISPVPEKEFITCSGTANDFLKLNNTAFQKHFFTQLDSIRKEQYPNSDQETEIMIDLNPLFLKQFLTDLNKDSLRLNNGFEKEYNFDIAPKDYKDSKSCADKISIQYHEKNCRFRLEIYNTFLVEPDWCTESMVVYVFGIEEGRVVDFWRNEAG